MQYFGFDRPSFSLKTISFPADAGPKLSANFTTGEYKASGTSKKFSEVFTFNRAGKAWLVKDTGLVEYAVDVPRLDNGLLLEQSATNLTTYSASDYLSDNQNAKSAANTTTTFNNYPMLGVEKDGYHYKNRRTDFDKPSVCSFYMPTNTPANSFGYLRQVNATVTPKVAGLSRFVDLESTATSNNNRYGIITIGRTYAGVPVLLGLFQEEIGNHASSLIKTTSAAVTRPSDFITSKITTGSTLTGDWDATLNLSLVNGQIVHSGYGRIRSLEIN